MLIGFAGSAADCITLIEKFENFVERYPSQTLRCCVNFAKLWRTDKILRKYEATLLVADRDLVLELDGSGNLLESEEECYAIGSGGEYAFAAAKALCEYDKELSAEEICERAMKIAADICIYTNHNFVKEILN